MEKSMFANLRNDGAKIKCAILKEEHWEKAVFSNVEGAKGFVPVDRATPEQLASDKYGPKQLFRYSLYNFDEDCSQILDAGWSLAKQVKSLKEDYDLTTHVLTIKRVGTGKSTTYTCGISPLTEAQKAKLANAKVFDLSYKTAEERREAAASKSVDL